MLNILASVKRTAPFCSNTRMDDRAIERYSPNEDEHPLIALLEENHLVESGGLTNKATWILSRSSMLFLPYQRGYR